MASTDTRLTQLLLDEFNEATTTDEELLALFVDKSDGKPGKVNVQIQAAKHNTILRKEVIADLDKAIRTCDHAIEERLTEIEKTMFKANIDVWLNRKHFEDAFHEELTNSTPNENSFINKCISELLAIQGEKKAVAEAIIKEIQQTKHEMIAYYELRRLKHFASVNPEHIPEKIVNSKWFLEHTKKFSNTVLSLSHAALVVDMGSQAGKTDFFHNFGAEIALTSGLGLVLQAYTVASLLCKKNKTHEDKLDIAVNSAGFMTNLVRYPKAMLRMLQQCQAHISNHVVQHIAAISTAAMWPLLGVSILIMAVSSFRLQLYNKDIRKEKGKQDAIIVTIIQQAKLQSKIPMETLTKAQKKLLVKAIINPDYLSDSDNANPFIQKIKPELTHWFNTNPSEANNARVELYQSQLQIENIRFKKQNAIRNIAVQSVITALTIITFAFPPSAMATLPLIAIVALSNFIYSIARDIRKKKAMTMMNEEVKEQGLCEENPENDIGLFGHRHQLVEEDKAIKKSEKMRENQERDLGDVEPSESH